MCFLGRLSARFLGFCWSDLNSLVRLFGISQIFSCARLKDSAPSKTQATIGQKSRTIEMLALLFEKPDTAHRKLIESQNQVEYSTTCGTPNER